MGIDIQLYRLRIGRFGPGRGYRVNDDRETRKGRRYVNSNLSRYSWISDLPYRLLATFLVVGVVLFMCREVMRCKLSDKEETIRFCSGIDPLTYSGYHLNFFISYSGRTITSAYTYTNYYARLLMLSADVESNPGPLSENEQVLFDAMKASESRVLSEIQEVKGDIKTMKNEIRYVKNECMKTKEEVEIVKQKQLGCEKHIRSMYKDIKNIQSENETMQLDSDHLNDNFEEKLTLMTDLEDQIDRLERESRKSTMQI